jgi:uncharacterized membrane protein
MKAAFALAILIFAQCAAGELYYADVVVDVQASGVASVSGLSNHQSLQPHTTDSLTSKKSGFWLFNLTLPPEDNFSDYVYEVRLPQDAEVNYVKSEGRWRIATFGDRISLIGTGSGQSLGVVIQYRITAQPREDYSLPLAAAAAVFVVAAAAYYLPKRRRDKSEEAAASEPESAVPESHAGMLTERQKEILRILSEAGAPVNQTLICERLDLPKSSVSRNISTLAKLGLVEKTRVGMSTFISLPKR